jgi:cellulose synthase/poly-beta-1,6-N-acetylglucosamine synthase-like glycosyltransferase
MQSRNVDFRVIVVNDGSTDKTDSIVRDLAARDGRIVLISKANGGKASALNEALSVVTAPVMVGIDGDTHIDQDALAALAEWFAIPDIGAVAGNVQVGNPQNVITRWQAIEYVTSQNIDRRALARLDAVTVVPGAIGAWRVDAVRAVGGYVSDTLAEDMDLTWRLHIAGWRIANEPRARAYTEAPATLGALLKQRFRWTYGTLQCLFKHAGATFHYGWFGKLALPSLWLFQIVAQVLAPFVDIELIVALFDRAMKGVESFQHEDVAVSDTTTVWWVIGVYLAFVSLELVAGIVAFKLDRGDARVMWLQPLQRFVYRQIMYLVAWRAIGRALAGASQAWGKLRRTGAVAQFGRPDITDRAA